MLTRIFSSNPVSFALGVGVGVIGLYLVHKAEEKKKMETTLKEMEDAIKVLEMRKLAVVESEGEVAKAV